MPIDALMILESGQVVTADSNSDYVESEGGFLAWASLQMGVMSGGSTTFDCRVEVSPDLGVNYYMAGKFQQFGPTDDSKFARIPVYIMRPNTAGNPVRVRLNYDVGGVTPSYAVTQCTLDAMLSMAVPAGDEDGDIGAALKMAAV